MSALGAVGALLVFTAGPLAVLVGVGWLCYRAGQHDQESRCWVEYSRWAQREALLARVLREDTRAMAVLPRQGVPARVGGVRLVA